MQVKEHRNAKINLWQANSEAFQKWLGNRESTLGPGLSPEPSIKVLAFLALLEAGKSCSYDEIRKIFHERKVILGTLPDITLRTSILNLGKTLEKFKHPLELKSFRGRFQLIPRNTNSNSEEISQQDPIVLLLHPTAISIEEIAQGLIEKAMLPLPGLYFLERSAQWWEANFSKDAEIRAQYEADAWEKLGIKNRLCTSPETEQLISVLGLATGDGLAEIEILKKILRLENKKVHYLAVDSSSKLLRDHIGLLKEALSEEIENGKLICGGVLADLFTGLDKAIDRVRVEFKNRNLIKDSAGFLPASCNMLVTYLGNCIGNNSHDQETEFFSMIQSIFPNRPLEILTGVSTMRSVPDKYIRNWDDFLLRAPRHLLETGKLLKSSRTETSNELPEFNLSEHEKTSDRCPEVRPEQYIVRHQIQGEIYRFYYRLAFNLELAADSEQKTRSLPKGTLILLHSIIKYNLESLINGIEKSGLFKTKYDQNYHLVLETVNGKREYAVFSTILN